MNRKKKKIVGGWKKHGKTTPFYAMRRICRFSQLKSTSKKLGTVNSHTYTGGTAPETPTAEP